MKSSIALLYIFSSLVLAQDLSGVIIDQQGKAVDNAKVTLNKAVSYSNEQGVYQFSNLSSGKKELHISAKGFSHINEWLIISENDTQQFDVTLSQTMIEVVDVYATPLHASTVESALPINVLTSDELRLKQSSTLGETLKKEVGVHSSYYGPNSSSPIIRGLDGARVLVSQNGLDVGDASRIGADHVVSAETSTASQIEVLRGPATLFYGSGAIGGVVNVVDNRVPSSITNEANYMLKHQSVSDENEASVSLNTGKDNVALHLDGFWRESNDYNIPEKNDEGFNTLENSAAESSGFTIGTSYLLDNGYVGFSYGRLDREYGIVGHGHEEEHGDEHEDETHEEAHGDEEQVLAVLKQNRYQILSELSFDNRFINKLSSKFAYTDYQHQEIEDGDLGTQFTSEMFEGRFDIYHQAYQGWKGAWTLHAKRLEFDAAGDEAFTPPSTTETLALAWLEEKHFDNVLVQLGFRVESVKLDVGNETFHDEDSGQELPIDKQSFTPISSSIGAVWDYQQGYNIGLSASYSQRAPSAAELFSNGAHIGTSTYEVGAIYGVEEHEGHAEITLANQQNVELESATNLDITWRKFEGDFGFVIGAFYNHIDDYYFLQNTGLFAESSHGHEEENEEADGHEEEGELPIYHYQQSNVDLYGFEAELFYQINTFFKLSIYTDYIRAKLTQGDNLPRISPMRMGSELSYQGNRYDAALGFQHYFTQNDIAPLETSTDGYTLFDAHLNYYLDGIGNDFVVFIKGDNLTNEDARVHTSFLKDIAPLPARNISIGVRGSF
jgi:iron complex outermembrane receptor protein